MTHDRAPRESRPSNQEPAHEPHVARTKKPPLLARASVPSSVSECECGPGSAPPALPQHHVEAPPLIVPHVRDVARRGIERWGERRQTSSMPTHYVCKRGYWEEYESYRDERGRPRQRFIKYWGKRDPRRRWGGVGPAYGLDWEKIGQDELERMRKAEVKHYIDREVQAVLFQENTGLKMPGGPPVIPGEAYGPKEKPPSIEPAPVASKPASETQQSTPDSSSSDAPTNAGAETF
jgi:hypothetical protein